MRVVDSAWMLCISIKLMYFQARGILLEKNYGMLLNSFLAISSDYNVGS